MKSTRHLKAAGAVLGIALAGAVAAGVGQRSPALPDPHLTPGATRSVTVAQLCVPGYTATIRANLTPAQQRQVDHAYHWTYAPGKQEYDHLIPLELGGDNGIANIWPEPIAQARQKDVLENRLHALVCRHQIPLQNAQACIRTDWLSCQRRYP